jgi:hypothetical protein
MQRNPFFSKPSAKATEDKPTSPSDKLLVDESNPQVADHDLCHEMLIMSKFATCYPNFFPDQSLFR